MKKIVFNGDTVFQPQTFGIQRFEREILKALDPLLKDENMEVELLVPSSANMPNSISFQNIKIVPYGRTKHPIIWKQFDFPHYVIRNHAVGVDCTLALPIWKCDIVCLHDSIVENYPENYRTIKEKLKRRIYIWKAGHAAKKSRLVVTVSRNSLNDICRYYKIPADKIHIIPNAWQHFQRIHPDESVFEHLSGVEKGRYFFSLGSRFLHKNH